MGVLVGHELDGSQEINRLIGELVSGVILASKSLGTVRGPDSELEEINRELVEELGALRGRSLFYPYIGTGAGRGCYVELEDGSVKLDLINGIGIHILGHSHPEILEAGVRGALSDIMVQGNLQANSEYGQFMDRLIGLAGRSSRLKYAWITTSGSMANENALKSCRQKFSPAKKIVAMESAFAGRTTMMAEVTDNDTMRVGLPRYDEVLRIPFYDPKDPESSAKSLEALEGHIRENKNEICAFIFEIMQGEGGYRYAPKEFFIPLFEACRREKIAIWADEIQTFCRTGEFFAFETIGVGEYIDVCTIAKTAQVAATLYTEEINPKVGLIAGTFAGATPALRAGIAILDELADKGYMGSDGKIAKIHFEFIEMLNRLNETTCKGLLREVRGLGLMVAVIPLDGSREKMVELLKILYKNGLITFGCGHGPFRLRFLLPAVMTSRDIRVTGEILERSILEMA
ncbi:aminotransferase class III-fold pyridoxal phosphate-dependent enzyme [Bdellovibrionales bacterium]|nr:aminotransferase class III-fold pyridoxal phosphate-dependent enzyme [Bdellovibrionales bacterium]